MYHPIDIAIIAPAFVAGLLVLATHVPLGNEVLKRGIIFIDLAIAQIAGLGVMSAYYFGWDEYPLAVQFAAIGSALIASLFLSWLEKYYPTYQEALIGITFVLAATASILLLSNNPHGGESLKDLLVGQILWTTWEQLLPTAGVMLLVLIGLIYLKNRFKQLGFYVLFAIAITTSVQLIGVYLVFASLIIPALSSANYNRPLLVGYIIGCLGYGLGLIISSMLDLPSGAVIVWSIAVIGLLFNFVLKPKSIHRRLSALCDKF